MATYIDLFQWGRQPIYLFWRNSSTYLSAYLFRRGLPPIIYLGGDGHVYPPIWEGVATYLPIREEWPPINFGGSCLPIYLFI